MPRGCAPSRIRARQACRTAARPYLAKTGSNCRLHTLAYVVFASGLQGGLTVAGNGRSLPTYVSDMRILTTRQAPNATMAMC